MITYIDLHSADVSDDVIEGEEQVGDVGDAEPNQTRVQDCGAIVDREIKERKKKNCDRLTVWK